MSFLAQESPPDDADEPDIENDGFWPDVSPGQVRLAARLDGTVTPARLDLALKLAMADVNFELQAWADAKQEAGYNTAASVPAPQVAGESTLLTHYNMAIISHVQAGLCERFRDFDTTGEGDKKADELAATASEHRRNKSWAISRILGQSRTTVELI